jgi:hypothetical protein
VLPVIEYQPVFVMTSCRTNQRRQRQDLPKDGQCELSATSSLLQCRHSDSVLPLSQREQFQIFVMVYCCIRQMLGGGSSEAIVSTPTLEMAQDFFPGNRCTFDFVMHGSTSSMRCHVSFIVMYRASGRGGNALIELPRDRRRALHRRRFTFQGSGLWQLEPIIGR